MKINKIKMIISTAVIFIPTIIYLIFSKSLSEQIAIHWGLDGNPDGYASPLYVALFLPTILAIIQWLCVYITKKTNENNDQNKKVTEIIYWICPAISLFSNALIISVALGYEINIYSLMCVFFGILFIFIGNYMPKTTRNRSIGIKIKWTLSNDENWNATHRLTGKIYVVSGFLSLLAIPFPAKFFPIIMGGIIIVSVVIPVVYSYIFYKKQLADGRATKEDYEKAYGDMIKNPKRATVISIIAVVVLGVVLSVIMFTGQIEPTLSDSSLVVKASFAEDITLKYESIESIEYRESGVDGNRIMGFGSARLLIGTFSNSEFGTYTRYTYTGNKPCVVIKTNGRTVVVGADDEQTVREIYNRISSEISK